MREQLRVVLNIPLLDTGGPVSRAVRNVLWGVLGLLGFEITLRLLGVQENEALWLSLPVAAILVFVGPLLSRTRIAAKIDAPEQFEGDEEIALLIHSYGDILIKRITPKIADGDKAAEMITQSLMSAVGRAPQQ